MFLAVKAAENRVERRPWVAWLIVAGVILAATEFGLRIAAPDVLEFAYDFRQVYRYHDSWYTDQQASFIYAVGDSFTVGSGPNSGAARELT